MFLSFVFDVPPSLPSAAWGGVSVCSHYSLHTPARFSEDLDDEQQCRTRSNICNFYIHGHKSYIICCDWYQNCAVRTSCVHVLHLSQALFSYLMSELFSPHLLYNSIFWSSSYKCHVHNKIFFLCTLSTFSPVPKWTWIKLSTCKLQGYRREIVLQWITPLRWLQGVVPAYCSGTWLLKSCR